MALCRCPSACWLSLNRCVMWVAAANPCRRSGLCHRATNFSRPLPNKWSLLTERGTVQAARRASRSCRRRRPSPRLRRPTRWRCRRAQAQRSSRCPAPRRRPRRRPLAAGCSPPCSAARPRWRLHSCSRTPSRKARAGAIQPDAGRGGCRRLGGREGDGW